VVPPRLRLTDIRKSFGATQALRGVHLTLQPGHVHALIGENGAGKSTLMKVLSGAHAPDSGSIELDGVPFNPRDPLQARRAGIAMIYQELNLAPDLSVEENILLGDTPHRLGWIRKTERRQRAFAALSELKANTIPLDAPVRSLTIAQQQLVEIARALLGHPKVLIMDEPTSSLTRVDTENLFQVIAHLRSRGVSVVYISHFLEECQRVCDDYTVLRDGESVGHGSMKDAQLNNIIRLMVGRDVHELYPQTPHQIGEPVLTLENLRGKSKPSKVSFSLRRGEILGIAGLVGAGRTETLRALFGLDPSDGRIDLVGANPRKSSPTSRLQQGVGLLSENRKEEGLLLNRSIADNLLLTRLQPMTRMGWLQPSRIRETARHWMEAMEVKAPDASTAIGHLSGGNQQKVALGRLLYHDARILLLDEPTRGIDVGSKASIYRRIGEAAQQGKSVIFVSSYLPELLGVCDTIGVMCRGVLTRVRPASEWTEQSIIAAAIGQTDSLPQAPSAP
jgi:ribose transport system ATP-binding protein